MQTFKRFGTFYMKKCGKLTMFFLILALLFAGLSHVMVRASMGDDSLIQDRNKNFIQIQKEQENTIDMIVLGDSLSYSTVSPMELWNKYGMSSFVCGQAGQKIQESYYMLKTALEHQSPKLVVMETNVLFRKLDGENGIMESMEELGKYYVPLFRLHDMWKTVFPGKKYLEDGNKGFIFRCGIDPYEGGAYMIETDQKRELSEPIREYMDKIIALCQEKGAQLMLLSIPSPKNYNYRKHNGLEAYAKEKELSYLDLNLETEQIGINWMTDSLDKGDHLNLSGARKVTEYLGEYLQSHFTFADHRGEAAYASWEQVGKVYSAQETEKMKSM